MWHGTPCLQTVRLVAVAGRFQGRDRTGPTGSGLVVTIAVAHEWPAGLALRDVSYTGVASVAAVWPVRRRARHYSPADGRILQRVARRYMAELGGDR